MKQDVSVPVPPSDMHRSHHAIELFLLLVVVVAAAGCSSSDQASPPARTLDVLSFTPPAGGWETTQKAGSGPITMRNTNKANDLSCLITVHTALQSSGNLAEDFFSEWTEIVGRDLPEEGDVSDQSTRISGVAQTTSVSGQREQVRLITYSAGAKIASIVVVTPSVAAYESYCPNIESFLASVVVNTEVAGTPRSSDQKQGQRESTPAENVAVKAAATGTLPDTDAMRIGAELRSATRPVQSVPANPNELIRVDAWNTSIRMSDLSGKWISQWRDEGFTMVETLLLKGDGTFTGMAQGRGSRTFDQENHGTFELSPKPVLIYARSQSSRPFNITGVTPLPDGSSMMSILDSHYPINQTSRGMYELKFVRAAEPRARPN
jgi:hypothetical protein